MTGDDKQQPTSPPLPTFSQTSTTTINSENDHKNNNNNKRSRRNSQLVDSSKFEPLTLDSSCETDQNQNSTSRSAKSLDNNSNSAEVLSTSSFSNSKQQSNGVAGAATFTTTTTSNNVNNVAPPNTNNGTSSATATSDNNKFPSSGSVNDANSKNTSTASTPMLGSVSVPGSTAFLPSVGHSNSNNHQQQQEQESSNLVTPMSGFMTPQFTTASQAASPSVTRHNNNNNNSSIQHSHHNTSRNTSTHRMTAELHSSTSRMMLPPHQSSSSTSVAAEPRQSSTASSVHHHQHLSATSNRRHSASSSNQQKHSSHPSNTTVNKTPLTSSNNNNSHIHIVQSRKRFGALTAPIGPPLLESFISLPKAIINLWSFLILAIVTCLDRLLDLYLLPLRPILFQKITNRHVFMGVLSLIGAFSLLLISHGESPFDAYSNWYHFVQGISALKLYVMCNMLEVFERLMASFGSDLLEALYTDLGWGGEVVVMSIPKTGRQSSASSSSATHETKRLSPSEVKKQLLAEAAASSPTSSLLMNSLGTLKSTVEQKSFLRSFLLIAGCLIVTSIHAFLIALSAVVYNVALNGDSYSLLALLASNNFSELRKIVFKRNSPEELFRVACTDAMEHVQLFTFFVVMLLRHTQSMSGFGTVETHDMYLILVVEVVIDTMKHIFVTRANGIKDSIYARFEGIWFWDVARDIFRQQYLKDCEHALERPERLFANQQHQQSQSSQQPQTNSSANFAGKTTSSASTSKQAGGSNSSSILKPSSSSATKSSGNNTSVGHFPSHTQQRTPAAAPTITSREASVNSSTRVSSSRTTTAVKQQQEQFSMANVIKNAAAAGADDTTNSTEETVLEESTSSTTAATPSAAMSPLHLPNRQNASSSSTSTAASPLKASQTLPPKLSTTKNEHSTDPSSSHQQQPSTTTPTSTPTTTTTTTTVLTSYTTTIDESLLIGFPYRRCGLVPIPYVSVLWWISSPLFFSVSSSALIWCTIALCMFKLLLRAVNRGFAARWLLNAKSWGPMRPPPHSRLQEEYENRKEEQKNHSTSNKKGLKGTPSSSSVNKPPVYHVLGGGIDELAKLEQKLLESLDKMQQFRTEKAAV